MNMMANQMVNQLFAKFGSNPLFQQAQQMAQGKSPDQIKQTCINICNSKGLNFDQAWQQFQSQFPGLK
jgi:hypothetical protein